MYALVKFLDENDAPGIVCTHWISEDENLCQYPNVRTNQARDKLLRRLAVPDPDWFSCQIKILRKYSNFSVAIQHLRKAEDTSNLESEDEICNRPRKRKQKRYPGEESDYVCKSRVSQKSARKTGDVIPCPVRPSDPCPTHSTFEFQPHTPPSLSSTPRIPSNSQITSNTPDIYLQSKKRVSLHSGETMMNGKLEAWMADMSVKVKKMDSKLDQLLEYQAKLLLSNHQVLKSTSTENLENLEVLGNIPVNDDESFMHLNQKISKEGHLRHLLIKVLISVGGKDLRSHIHNMLRRVLKDEVAELYNLSGKSTSKDTTKKSFMATEVSKLILSACQRVHKDLATEVTVKEAVGDWLHQAKVRKMRRMQRHEKSLEKSTDFL